MATVGFIGTCLDPDKRGVIDSDVEARDVPAFAVSWTRPPGAVWGGHDSDRVGAHRALVSEMPAHFKGVMETCLTVTL